MGTELTAQTLTVTITEALAVDHANLGQIRKMEHL